MQRVRVDVATGADRWTVTVRHDTTPSRELGVFDMPWVDLAVPTSIRRPSPAMKSSSSAASW